MLYAVARTAVRTKVPIPIADLLTGAVVEAVLAIQSPPQGKLFQVVFHFIII